MLTKSILALGLTALASTAALASDAIEAPKTEAAKALRTKNGEQLFCMKSEAFTGSRLAKTECKTKAQWASEGVEINVKP